jgi:hypothetical protein
MRLAARYGCRQPVPLPSGLPSGPQPVWHRLASLVGWLRLAQQTLTAQRFRQVCRDHHRPVRVAAVHHDASQHGW